MLARLRRSLQTPLSADAGDEPTLTQTEAFGDNPGALRMLSYAPANLAPKAPLVVVLHGCAQTAQGHAASGGWIALAQRLGFVVLAPEQPAANNPNRCFNWFEAGDITRDRGEAASIAAMIACAVAAHDCDPRRVFVTGLSAGGAMSAVMLATYPELFAGGAIVAGLAYGVARGIPDALRVMGRGDGRDAAALADLVGRRDAAPLRLSIWHGDADYTVSPANAQDLASQWTAATGLDAVSGQVEVLAGRTRSTWAGDAAGSVVELNIVHGLGHGTPLSTKGLGDVGTPAPYMLEAGLSSTLEIASFWGLGARQDQVEVAAPSPAPTRSKPKAASAPAATRKPVSVADQVMDAISGHTPAEVRDVIAKALRVAGLMK